MHRYLPPMRRLRRAEAPPPHGSVWMDPRYWDSYQSVYFVRHAMRVCRIEGNGPWSGVFPLIGLMLWNLDNEILDRDWCN